MSPLVICEMLGMFPNTLTPHGKLSFCNSQNLLQPIQIQLSQKQETCSQCFAKFLKFT